MEWIETRIDLPKGLHMRPLQYLQERASCCRSDLKIVFGDREYDAKSILDMIEMAASDAKGKMILMARGEDAKEGMKILKECLSRKKVGGRASAADHRPKSTP